MTDWFRSGSHRVRIFLGTSLLLALAATARAGEPTLAETFDHTARCRGAEYVIGRDLLLTQGERLRPLLADRRADPHWGARQLAAALTLRLDDPARVEALRLTLDRDTLTVTTDDIPILIEILRENGLAKDRRSPHNIVAVASVRCLGLLRAVQAVPVLIELLDGSHRADCEPVYQALVQIGAPARALLLERFRVVAVGEPRTSTEHDSMRGSCRVARALGRLGGSGVEAVLLEKFAAMERAGQVEAVAEALLDLRSEAGLAAIFDRQLEVLAKRRLRLQAVPTDHLPGYGALRETLRGYGEQLEPFLSERSTPDGTLAERVLAGGLRFELEHPEEAGNFYRALGRARQQRWRGFPGEPGPTPEEEETAGREHYWSEKRRWGYERRPGAVPVSLRREAAQAFFDVPDIEWLARRTSDDLDTEIVIGALLGPLRDRPAGEVPLILADREDPRMLEVYRELLEIPDPPRWPRPAPYVPQLVAAMLRIGDAGAIPLLQLIIEREAAGPGYPGSRYREALPLAREALAFFERGDGDYGALLDSAQPEVRLAAARTLSRTGDLRALPVLLDAVLADPEGAYLRLRPSILSLGTAALPGIAARRETTVELLSRVVFEALTFRLKDPDGARRVDGVIRRSVPVIRHIKGPQLSDYIAGGKKAASQLKAGDRPIIEEITLFPLEHGLRRVALFALTEQGNEPSIPVVVRVARTDRSAAVAALEMFGPAGLLAAKEIPLPDPARPAFGPRGTRHAAAAETLARAKDPLAVDKILDVLTAPEPEEYSAMQAARRQTVEHLQLAAGIHDERFVEPVIHLLTTTRWHDVQKAAFEVIGWYEDERIVPLCLPHIPERLDSAPLRALVRQLKSEVGPVIFARFMEAGDEGEKLRYATALSRLRRHGTYRGYQDPAPDDSAERREAVKGSEELALQALGTLLETASRNTQRKAAEELGNMYLFEENPAALEQTLTWLLTEPEPPRSLVYRLWESKLPGAAEALLLSYIAGEEKVGCVAEALGRLGHRPALPALIRGLERGLEQTTPHRHAVPEIAALARLSEKGRVRVLQLLESDAATPFKVEAAYSLGEAKYEPAFDATEVLLGVLLEKGLSPDDGTPECGHIRRQESVAVGAAAHALAKMSPAKAHRSLSLLLMTEERERLREIILSTLASIAWKYPELKPAPAELR